MSLFNKYLCFSFIRLFCLFTLMFLFLILISNTIRGINLINEFDTPILNLLIYQIIWLPIDIVNVMSQITFLGILVVMAVLQKNSEIIAYVSLGGRIRRLMLPAIITGTIVASFVFIIDNFLVPEARYYSEYYKNIVIYQDKNFSSLNRYHNFLAVDNKGNTLFIKTIEPVKKQLYGIKSYHIDYENLTINNYSQVEYLENKNGVWYSIANSSFLKDINSNVTIAKPGSIIENNNLIKIEDTSFIKPTEMNMFQLLRAIGHNTEIGLSTFQYRFWLFSKISNLLSIYVVLFLTIPIMINYSRSSSSIGLIGRTLLVGALYFGLISTLTQLSRATSFNPAISLLLPNVAFLAIGVLNFLKVEKR